MDMTTLNLGGALALGQRIVLSVDGTIKVLDEEQPLQAGDVVLESSSDPDTPQLSATRFSPEDGGEVELDQDIANIFTALEEGQDPTVLSEEFATAAGQNGSSLSTSGTIERNGEETIPGTEFITTGFEALGMSRTQSLSLLDAFRSFNQSPNFVDNNNVSVEDTISFSTNEDTRVNGTLSALDQDGDSLSFAKATDPLNGTVVVDENGDWTYTPNENYNGDDSFTVVVSDGEGGTDTVTVNIGVTPVNDAPVAEPKEDSLFEGQVITGSLSATDVDLPEGELLAFTTDSDVDGLELNLDGTYTFDASSYERLAEGERIVIQVPVSVTDDLGATDTTLLTITVTGTNDTPVVDMVNTGSVKEDTDLSDTNTLSTSGALTFSDVDTNDTPQVTFTEKGLASWTGGVLTSEQASKLADGFALVDGKWTYDVANSDINFLAEGESITLKFDVTVDDGNTNGSVTETVTITINGTNDTPVVDMVNTGSVKEDTDLSDTNTLSTSGTLTFSDVDTNDTPQVTFTEKGLASWTGGVLTSEQASKLADGFALADGKWTYDVANSDINFLAEGESITLKFDVTVDDGNTNGSVTETVTITINGTNDGPVAIDDTYQAYSETLLFSESFENMTSTGRWTVISGDQLDDWSATQGLEIQHESVVNKASDGEYIAELDAYQNTAITTSIDTSGQDSMRVDFDYNPRRDGNSSSDMTFKVGDTLVTVHADGTLSGADGLNVQIGQPDVNGWYRITAEFEVHEDMTDLTFAGAGASDSYGALLDNITVTGVTQPQLVTEEDQPITISFAELLANDTDVDGDELSIVEGSITSVTNGTLSVDYNDKTITFMPSQDYNGEATFTYQVTDGHGGTEQAVVTINVKPVNDAPEFMNENGTNGGYEFGYDEGIDDSTVIGTVAAEDIDNTQSELSFSFQSGNEQGWFEIDNQGRITLTSAGVASLANDFDIKSNIHNLVVTVSDGTDSVDTTVKLTEDNLNDEDTKFDSDNVMFNYQENLAPNVTIGTVTATDKDGSNITYSIEQGDNLYIEDKPLYQVDPHTGEISLTEEGAVAFTNDYESSGNSHLIKVTATGTDGKGEPTVGTISVTLNEADDESDNKPQAEDFSVSLDAQGKSSILFDSSDESSDQISDKEDDRANIQLGVIITELPDSGTLYYVNENNVKTEVIIGEKYDDPNRIVYEDDQESTGFFLGVDDTSTLDKGPHSTAEFHNWGDEVDAYTRELKFDNGDVVTITSEGRNNLDAKPLVQNNSQQGHMGFGIASTNRGIHQDEAIKIDFSSRPADSVTVGLSGLGGWFAPNADDSIQSRAEITVTFDYGDGITEEKTFLYDDTHNNQNVTIVAPEGAEIVSVEASTQGPGNWELTSLETKASDSFEYKAVDSDGNESDIKTVTIDKSGDLTANNDPQSFEVKLGEFSEDNDSPWSVEGAELNASFNGQDRDFAHSGIKIGVAGQVGGLGAQIEYDRAEQQSEKFEIHLDNPATQFTFSVSNLFKNEGNDGNFTDNHEQGSWVAYLNGVAVAGDTFIAEDGNNKGTYEITPLGPDGTPIAFDTVVFEATEYSNQATHDNDASDYFLTGFKASSEGAYAVNQGGILEIPTSKLAGLIGSELLNNDIDSDGDNLRITYVYGETEGNAYIKDGIVYFDLTGDDFVGETTFKYQITDDNGQVASAEVNVIVNPLPTPASVASVDLLADSVIEGDDLGFKVTLDSSALVETQLDVRFGKDTDDAQDSGNEKDLDLSKLGFTNGVTYDEQSGKLIVPVGVKGFAVLIPTLVDGVHELDESYSLTVDGVSDTGIIENVDTIELTVEGVADVAEGSNAVFEVSLNNPSSENIDVSLAISLTGNATSAETRDFKDIGELYTVYYLQPQLSGEVKRVDLDVVIKDGKPTVTIPSGETEIVVEVATKDDLIFEGGEDFNLVVTDESGYISNGSDSDQVTILDDGSDPDGPDGPQVNNDDRPIVQSISDIEIEEGLSGTFIVELSNHSESITTIEMSLNDGSAVSADGQPTEGDFNGSRVVVTFGQGADKYSETVEVINGKFVVSVPEGHDSFAVEVATNQDTHSDNNEMFSISGNAPHQQDAVTGVATIVDNEAPMVDLNGALYDIEYVSEGAGYSNVFGYYINDDSGEKPLHVLVSNSNDPSLSPGTLLDSPLASIDNLEFFLIPNGFNKIDSDKLDDLKVNDQGQLVVDGVVQSGIPVYRSTDEEHQISTSVDSDGNLVLSFDDQKGQGNDDNDFNDLVIKVSKVDTDGIDDNSAYVEGEAAAIADINADVFDDKDIIKSMNVTLINAKEGDNLTWPENSGFNVSKSVNGTLIALVISHPSGDVSAHEFEAFLKSIRFVNSSDTPDEETRLVEVTVSDGVNQSETATASISVTGTDELSFSNVAGIEDQFIDLNMSVADALTSVSTIELSGIPQGAIIVVGGVESTVDNSGTVIVGIDDIASVKVKALEHSDVNFEISVTAKDADQQTVETGRIHVDVHPDADKPTLVIGDFEKVAAIDFEDVEITSGSWDSDIEINNVKGTSTIGEWNTSNSGKHVEVGTEGTYLTGSSDNKVMEIEGEVGDKVLYTDMDLVAGRFYNFKFDIAARDDVNPSDSDMEVSLFKLDDSGNPIESSKVTLYDFIAERQGSGWQEGTFTLPVEDSGKYRLVLEADEADSTGAIIDNIQFTAVDNYGYEDSFIKLSEISSSLVDATDGSETLTVELEGLPVGSLLVDGTHTYTVTEAGRIDVTGWDLAELQIKVLDPSTFDIKVIATATETDTNKDDDVHGEHGDLGGKLANASEATINVTVLERPQGPDSTNEHPIAKDFLVSSDTNVASINFAPNATDTEDDASSTDSKHTSVRIEELPEYGKLYEVNEQGEVIGDALAVGTIVLDSANVIYVANDIDDIEIGSDFTDVNFVVDNELNQKNNQPGVDRLDLDGVVVAGGLFDGSMFTDGNATIKYDHNPNQLGVFVHTSHDSGTGSETGIGEYISFASDRGNISSAEIYLSSVQGLLGNGNGNNQQSTAKLVAYLFDNGQQVGGPIELPLENVNHSAHTASVDVSSDSVTFDEVRLAVVNPSNSGQGAGFNVSAIEFDVNGVVGIQDDFKYSAVDSKPQDSLSQGTVTINATSIIGAVASGIDHVTVTGNNMVWNQSAAHTWETESSSLLGYDELDGAIINVGVGGDSVNMGAGSDTVYMGDSIVPGMDQNVNLDNQNAAIDRLIHADINGSTATTADDMTYGDEDYHHKLESYSNAGVDIVQSGGGNDTVYGEEGVDLIFGGTGHDVLNGGSGDDAVRGGSGNDTLVGGLGDDILVGDDGADLFQWVDQPFQGDVDKITDFALGEDHLDISQLLPTENSMSDLLEHITIEKVDNGGDKGLVITISEDANSDGQTQTIILDNTGNQFDSVNVQGDGRVMSSDLSHLVNQLFVNLPD
ncbi:tandem-95 repeat protein [Vibrio artabrorum]|uniref:tandem-95 repeat protein n=1 Tax=Vibrio artabrorum TaxID=446374 RepID=UPI0021C27864|nr:tandem-95 repeat protein [Vibrio artabrorum]